MTEAAAKGSEVQILPQETRALSIIHAISQQPGSIRTQAETLLTAVAELVIAQPVTGLEMAMQLAGSAKRAVIVSQAEMEENERLLSEDNPTARKNLGTLEQAADLDRRLQVAVKKLEERRLVVAGPLDKATKAWNGIFAPIRLLLDSSSSKAEGTPPGARQIIGEKMIAFKKAEMEAERQRQEELRKQQESTAIDTAQKMEAEGLTEEAAQVLEDALEAPAPAPVVSTTVRGDFGGTTSFREEWQLKEITDPAAVPREYCTPDESKIKKFIKDQPLDKLLEIPGCRIEKDLAKTTR